ncbi:MAG: SWIM zinc finger family protein, partial [Planctomycetaceae bacterium]|nr:SWIM zinc finger family protein [Planctomycetaceae bacterium]
MEISKEISSDTVWRFWESITWSDIAEQFGNKIMQRGRDYADNGNVDSIWITTDAKTILALVHGENKYKTIVRLEKSSKTFAINSSCSCPYGSRCKHAAAAIVVFLDCLAKNKPVHSCKQINETVWEMTTPSGETVQREFDLSKNENDEIEHSERIEINTLLAFLKQQIKEKSRKELARYILQLAKDHVSFRDIIRKEFVAHSIAEISDSDVLLQKAKKIIKKETNFRGYYEYGEYPPVDFSAVIDIVKQFSNVDNPLPPLTQIAEQLFDAAQRYYECSQAEDSYEFDVVFAAIVDVLLKSKCSPTDILLWGWEMESASDYAIAERELDSICKHPWAKNVWSEVADALTEKYGKNLGYYSIRKIITALDNADRQDEATGFLRSFAAKNNELRMLISRLVELNYLDEAEQRSREQLTAESKEKTLNIDRSIYVSFLKEIALKREDWKTLASIQAAELFDEPTHDKIKTLLATAEKLKGEDAVRQEIESFLLTGTIPAAVASVLVGKHPTKEQSAKWVIPVF